jgi:hypothetical protein
MEIDLGHAPYAGTDGHVVYVLLTYGGPGSSFFSVPLSRFFQTDPSGVPIQSYSAHSNTPLNDPSVCADCGQVISAGPMDGGGVGFSPNHKYAFYVGGRGNGELRILDVTDPVNMQTVVSVPVGPMSLHAGKEAGIVASRIKNPDDNLFHDYLFLAAGLAGFRVYEFPGLIGP